MINDLKACLIFYFCLLLPLNPILSTTPFPDHPADVSFLVIDLKYSRKQGVKICEVQQGCSSVFMGDDFVHDSRGFVAAKLCDFLSRYHNSIWFVGNICDIESRQLFDLRKWSCIPHLKHLPECIALKHAALTPVIDPYNLYQYHGILLIKTNPSIATEDLLTRYPGIIIVNKAVLPYKNDKYAMSLLLDNDPRLKQLKPCWKVYQKGYADQLTDTILNDFPSDYLVIKPRNSTEGRGVIIIHKNELKKTLEYIFKPNIPILRDADSSYRYWVFDLCENFIVEEFIESDPVVAPHLDNRLYDGTMRVVFALTYHLGKVDITFLDSHWQLPKKSLSEPGSFNEQHKSFGDIPYFLPVEPAIISEVEEFLRQGIPLLYQQILQRMNEERPN